MSDVEKSIYEQCDTDKDGYIVSRFDAQIKAYNLGRDAMLSEVLEYVSGQCECNLDRKCIACALESKFKGKT